MLKQERQKIILDQVYLHNNVLLIDLANQLEVSIDTIRRDVVELESVKKIKKVHGGATTYGFNSIDPKESNIFLIEKKKAIASKALSLIKKEQTLLISGGTTNLELVKILPKKLTLTVFTPSLHIALHLMEFPTVEVIFLGGHLLHGAKFAVGNSVIQSLSEIKVDLCFLGTGYSHPTEGLTEFEEEVAEVKKAMVRAAKQTVILSVSDKLHTVQRFKSCGLEEVHYLITELNPSNPLLDDYSVRSFQIL
ncbi:DeoR/GlpR family DNA-binding transcription regulator [Pararhodonellum marinum]|uniref:DeoR/GlpR family DNA-binding transcription regulator n=1 Tax=Pararhodonellum marinum TaxID=2755358 RepID=UPI00188F6971|nr:DeoR/GlpR family DNA-binding transcription regulator [Pararhodonellum marinum]